MTERRPWFSLDAEWWPVLFELLPRPLELEAILADLRYLENEARRGRPFPSLSELRKRYALGRTKVQRHLDDPRWHDGGMSLTLAELRTISRPANRLGVGVCAPIDENSTLETVEPDKPSDDQHADEEADAMPEGKNSTQTSTLETGEPGELAEDQHADQHADPRDMALAADNGAPNQYNQLRENPSDSPLVPIASARHELATLKRQAAARIYAVWYGHHPRSAAAADDPRRKQLIKCLELTAKALKAGPGRYTPEHWQQAEHDLIDLVGWFHTAAEASHWQGRNDRGKRYLKIANIFKYGTLGDRLDDMREWRCDGSAVNADLGLEQYEAEALGAWSHLSRLLLLHGSRLLEYELHPHADKAAAFAVAIEAVGVDAIAKADERHAERALRPEFVHAYCTARRDQREGANNQHRSQRP